MGALRLEPGFISDGELVGVQGVVSSVGALCVWDIDDDNDVDDTVNAVDETVDWWLETLFVFIVSKTSRSFSESLTGICFVAILS